MPNTESPIHRSTATFDGNEANKKSETKTGNVGSLKDTPGCPITSGSISEFYELKEKYSFPNVLEIINREFGYGDRKFPANSSSLGTCKSLGNLDIEWKRPHDITDNPKFFVNGLSQFDIVQGRFENSWFLAAVESLATKNNLLQKVVPMDQSFEKNYAGIFRFRFWQYGKWVDVVVDDHLPTYTAEDGTLRLFGAQPTPENTFWLPLLEKAYAKLHGSYQAIERSSASTGRSGDAMEDFTGGISDYYTPEYDGKGSEALTKVNFYRISKKASENESLVTCYIEDWAKLGSGVTGSHHCSVKRFDQENSRVEVVRIRHLDEKRKDGSKPKASEFISKEHFNQNCTFVEICHLNMNEFDPKLSTGSAKKKWQLCEIDGEWSEKSAGGPSQKKKFPTMEYNPRYCFKLEEDGNVIISLMRKPPSRKDLKGQDPLVVGFTIYSVPEHTVIPYPLDEIFFAEAHEVVFEYYEIPQANRLTQDTANEWKANKLPGIAHKIPGFKTESAPDSMQHEEYTRESNCRLKFKSGYYCLIVDNRDAQKGDFFLRIFSDNPITMKVDTPWLKRPLNPSSYGVTDCETPITKGCQNVRSTR